MSDNKKVPLPLNKKLASGCGGLTYGFRKAGIEVTDVADLSKAEVERQFIPNAVRVLAGCAPCQPFSRLTNMRGKRHSDWSLLHHFSKLVTQIKPEIVSMENVPDLTSRGSEMFDEFIFFDPPYLSKGSTLYTNFYKLDDHKELSAFIQQLRLSWLLTYDFVPEIRDLYPRHRQYKLQVSYSANKKRASAELLVASDDLKMPIANEDTLIIDHN